MSIRQDLQRSIHQVYKFNRDGSYATQADRRNILLQFAQDLVLAGFGLRDIRGLKQKHIQAVVKEWQNRGLKIPTIKNRMSVIRNLCEKINKRNIVPTNPRLSIGNRSYAPKSNRAIYNSDLTKLTNSYVLISVELQRLFGLRREESIKIKPYMADKGKKLELLASWCKGGRSRAVPIRTKEQRYWLEQAKKLAGKFNNSLIPEKKTYIQQRNVYDKQVARAGLKNLHGLRHAYAQQRYLELSGWPAPIAGGPKSSELTPKQKQIDFQARMILTEELGHSREQITVNYLGR
jgi:site-specific recombinase XerC